MFLWSAFPRRSAYQFDRAGAASLSSRHMPLVSLVSPTEMLELGWNLVPERQRTMAGTIAIVFALLLVADLDADSAAAHPCPPSDHAVLAELHKMFGDRYQVSHYAIAGGPDGSQCEVYSAAGANWAHEGTHISSLSIRLTGPAALPIPDPLSRLTNLGQLSLHSQQFNGPIPPWMGNFSNLRELYLGFNDLSGPIPPDLGNPSNLERLDLGANQLSGSIPDSLGGLSKLRGLVLSSNQLTGSVPGSLGNLSELHSLFLGDN